MLSPYVVANLLFVDLLTLIGKLFGNDWFFWDEIASVDEALSGENWSSQTKINSSQEASQIKRTYGTQTNFFNNSDSTYFVSFR